MQLRKLIERDNPAGQVKLTQQLDDEDKKTNLKAYHKMLKFKDFFQKNVAAFRAFFI